MKGGSLVLVAGLGEDSGKTSLAAGLLASFRSLGLEAKGFKPAGATNMWLHPEVLEETEKRGFLVTWDTLKLYRASGEDLDLRVMNLLLAFHSRHTNRGQSERLPTLAGWQSRCS